jgi:hypothetical protein
MSMSDRDSEKSRKRHYFSKAKEAKEKLAEKIETYVELHEKAARKAAERGDASPVQWLLAHAEVEDPDTGEKLRPIASSIDKQDSAQITGPQINVGLVLPGMQQLQPAQVIESDVKRNQLPSGTQDLVAKVEAGDSERKGDESLVIDAESDNSTIDN